MSLNRDVKVKIENLMEWDIGFHQYPQIMKPYISPSIVIKGGEISSDLTLGDILEQVYYENFAFCGLDGYGAHAPLRIVEDDIRYIVFGIDPKQLTKKRISDFLFTKKDKLDKFRNTMLDTIVTNSEARMILYKWEEYGCDKLPESKKTMLKEHCEYILKKY